LESELKATQEGVLIMSFYDYWMKVDFWPYFAAARLLNGVDPDKEVPENKIDAVNRTYRLFKLSVWDHYLVPGGGELATRETIIQFAIDKGIEIPEELGQKWVMSTVEHETKGWMKSLDLINHANMEAIMASNPKVEGRYNLKEADKKLAKGTGEKEGGFIARLKDAVADGSLLVYEPGSDIPYRPDLVRDFYEEAYWNDLNKWIAESLPRIEWKFSQPNPIQTPPKENLEERDKRIFEAALEAAKEFEREGKSWLKRDLNYKIHKSGEFPDIDIATIARSYNLKDIKLAMRGGTPF
jgi:hypothetical protein